MEAQVTAHSQPFRLRQEAQQANVRHGEEVRADIPNVRVSAGADPVPAHANRFAWFGRHPVDESPSSPRRTGTEAPGEVFFCSIGPIRVRERLSGEGDEAPLPSTVIVDGLVVPSPGCYDLVNVLVRTNGDLRVTVDAQSRLEPAGAASRA